MAAQTTPVERISVAVDVHHDGPGPTRNRALEAADTEWVAFLDDDDRWYPNHIETLLRVAEETDADLVYPWFDVHGGTDPLGREGLPFNGDLLEHANFIPVTYLVRTSVIKAVGGFDPDPDFPDCEDWAALVRMWRAGARFVHHPKRTWCWHHDGQHYSGRTW